MFTNSWTTLLFAFSLSALAAPLPKIRDRANVKPFVLPRPADGPGPTFDASATRAATAIQIKSAASPDICFDVSDFQAGDFRFNLVPVSLKKCDPSIDGQKFDLITKGAHNNVADGSRTIIVSSQQFTCVDKRGNKNDRTRPGLFACGGRAAGDGETTADQQFFFNSTATLSGSIGFPLARDSVNNGVGPGNQCLSLNRDGFLSNTPCSPPNFTPEQTWLTGGAVVVPSPVTATITTSAPVLAVSSVAAVSSSTTSLSATSPTTAPDTFTLPPPGGDGPGPTFDATATRAATGTQIRSVASPDICFDVSNFRAGDFRFNLVPVALKKCDTSVAGQKFDLITKGAHNNVADGSRTIIVSSQQFTCVDRRSNINDRTRPGLFACGGRAAGDGETTADQQYFFNATSNLSKGIGFPLARDAQNNGIGPGNQCLTLNRDGFLSNTPCSPPNFTPEQSWVVGDAVAVPSSAATSTISTSSAILAASTPVASASSTAPPVTATATPPATPPAPTSTTAPETFVLPPPGRDGPGPTLDTTANRAATGAQIRSAASPGICFDVSNFRAGDFRFNLVPVALKRCDTSVAGQKFDLITKGAHNDVTDGSRTIIVSSQQFTCVDRRGNINDRTRPGLFACGGRAAGDGGTSFDQQFFFNATNSLSEGIGFPLIRDAKNKGIGPGNQCLTLNADGFLSNTPCSPPNFTPEQTWFVGDSDTIPSSPAEPTTVTPPALAASTPITSASSTRSSTTPSATAPETFTLPPPGGDGPGPIFDTTATRAATGAQIKNVASPDICFDVSNFRAGDFRFNLVPIALKKCDASVAGQKFDLITKGAHNDVADGSRTIIVSSQQFTCVDRRGNINDRTRPGLFACGGRAAGDGATSFDQQYFFNATSSLSKGIGFPLIRDAKNNGIGPGNQCLTLNADGFLSNAPCSPPFFPPEQSWVVA